MSCVVAMGLIPILGWKVQMVTVILPVILLAVANDYGIHLLAKYQEVNTPDANLTGPELAQICLDDLGPPVIAAGVTTIAGLLCLTTHIIVPASQLGVLASLGVLFALGGSLCFIPAVLSVLPVAPPIFDKDGEAGILETGLSWTARRVAAYPRPILVCILLVTVTIATGIRLIEVDTNPVNYYPPSSPVAQNADRINENFGGSTELSVLITGDIQDPEVMQGMSDLGDALRANPGVGFTSSIADVVQKMNQAVMGGGDDALVIPETREAIAQYFLLYSMNGDPEDFERMVDFDYEHALLTARIRALSTSEIGAIVRFAEAWLEDNPIGSEPAMVAGFGPVFVDLVEAVVRGQAISLGLSLVLVFVLVALTFRSPSAGAYAVVPLLMAMPLLFGGMGYLGIELNIVTAMLSSIMVGVGVDYTIHFLWRYRDERKAGHAADQAVFITLTTAGRGIVFNALSVVVGFAVLLISNFLPVQFFGFLVVVSIGGCLIGALVVLPALVLVFRPGFLEPRD
jgi:predicted RND superfamily exporter protein